MLNQKFKVGDTVRIKKLSKEEFEEVYIRKHNNHVFSYNTYLFDMQDEFNKLKKIETISKSIRTVWLCDAQPFNYYPEELEKIDIFKLKLKFVKELLK